MTTPAELDDATQKQLESLIKQEEGDANRYRGIVAILLTLTAVAM